MSEPIERPSDRVRDELPQLTPEAGVEQAPGQEDPRLPDILEALREVVDPELMVNVVDLGLVYGVAIDDQGHVTIDMTLTSPACPLTDQIEYASCLALSDIASSVSINWVWMPPWSLAMITDEGREQLRYIGYNL